MSRFWRDDALVGQVVDRRRPRDDCARGKHGTALDDRAFVHTAASADKHLVLDNDRHCTDRFEYTADLRGSKYSPLDKIDASNFSKMEVAWRFKTDSLGPRPETKLEGTPLMVKNMVYATAGTRRAVVALDPKTGEILGGTCVGPAGGELIHEIVAAMHKGMTVRDLATMPHYHPTLAEIWTYPAEELADQIRV